MLLFYYAENNQRNHPCTSAIFAGDPSAKQTATIQINPKPKPKSTSKGLEKLKLTIDAPILPEKKNDEMDIKTKCAIIGGCVCVVLCFSSSVGSSSYGSVYCYRKRKERKELKKQKTTKRLPSNNPSMFKNNQGYTYAAATHVPHTHLLPQTSGVTKDWKTPVSKYPNVIPLHKDGENNEKKVEIPAESAQEPYQPLPEVHTARPLEPTTPQLPTAKPSDTNQQSPASKEPPKLAVLAQKKVDEAANSNKLKDTDYYVYGDDSKDENEKKGDKKGDKKDEKKEEKKESKDELKVEPTQDDKA
ncbi:hypothetical protein M3Y94_01279500 [Aphelenchoides besseyi]|nr:hypothetical protein M3Y94_01279500 [Aphelenchoides besseyi]